MAASGWSISMSIIYSNFALSNTFYSIDTQYIGLYISKIDKTILDVSLQGIKLVYINESTSEYILVCVVHLFFTPRYFREVKRENKLFVVRFTFSDISRTIPVAKFVAFKASQIC